MIQGLKPALPKYLELPQYLVPLLQCYPDFSGKAGTQLPFSARHAEVLLGGRVALCLSVLGRCRQSHGETASGFYP